MRIDSITMGEFYVVGFGILFLLRTGYFIYMNAPESVLYKRTSRTRKRPSKRCFERWEIIFEPYFSATT